MSRGMGKAGRKGRRSAGLAEGLRYAGPEAPTRRPRSPGPAVLIAVHDSLLVHQPRHLHQFLIEVHDRDRPQGVAVRPQAVRVVGRRPCFPPAGRGPLGLGRQAVPPVPRRGFRRGAGRVCKKHFSRMQKTFLRNMQKTFFPHAEGMFPAAMGRVALATVVIAKPQQDNADHSGIVRG